jgi:hypothetical protein
MHSLTKSGATSYCECYGKLMTELTLTQSDYSFDNDFCIIVDIRFHNEMVLSHWTAQQKGSSVSGDERWP